MVLRALAWDDIGCYNEDMPRRRYAKKRPVRDARFLIERALRELPQFGGETVVDGKIRSIHEGMWHQNFCFWIDRAKNASTEQGYFLRLLDNRHEWQQGKEPRERLDREAETLRVLRELEFDRPTPEFVCFVGEENERIGMIETALNGASLDKWNRDGLLVNIASVAASVHAQPVDRFPHLNRYESRKHHLQADLDQTDEQVFEEFEIARQVRDWITDYQPSSADVALLHGDLLPQNILIFLGEYFDKQPSLSIVDWEMACIGDPAYDLAIVSRGRKKVQQAGSLKTFVDEYSAAGGTSVTVRDVRAYELLLCLGWLVEAWQEHQKPTLSGHAPTHYVQQLESLLRRVR